MGDWRQQQNLDEQRRHIERFYNLAKQQPTKGQTKMAFAMKAFNGGGDFKQPTPGTVGAVCTRVIDMGTQESLYGPKRRVLLSFEIDEAMSDGRPFLVSSSYTLSFHEKANLRRDLESWRGKKFAEGEAFDLAAVIGKPALLNLVETDKGYTNIASVAPLPKGMPPLASTADPLVFNLDAPDWDAFNTLSERMQEKIAATPEYTATSSPTDAPKPRGPVAVAPVEKAPAVPLAADFDDDIPF